MKKSKPKRYWYSCVEEMILNPAKQYQGYRYFRVEIYDRHNRKDDYAIDEAQFMVPEELYEGLREAIDFKETNVLPKIRWPESKTKEASS